ncbi:Nitric oxide reductase activation protein NorD [hydrothermal vent metagenome]|uniref:Nitric oxide reductase activation protein NorD n=1 Tax=hydrothermal vent metagenome TaxID=652676 RepID=A0A3B0RVK4_9ZZZZ
MLDLFEPEELVGKKWHMLVRDQTSYPHHKDAAVHLKDIREMISVFFRAIGGDPGIDVSSVSETSQSHRLSWRMRLGMDHERIAMPKRDNDSLLLPASIDYFPEKHLNRSLYLWLSAFLAHGRDRPAIRPENPLHADLIYIAGAWQTTQYIIDKYPGLGKKYDALCEALAEIRPVRKLPTYEARLEKIIRDMLFSRGDEHDEAINLIRMILHDDSLPDFPKVPRKYKGFLAVPLWGEVDVRHHDIIDGTEYDEEDQSGQNIFKDLRDGRKHAGVREENDQVGKQDPIALNRFEKIISMTEMVNVNRGIDDDEDEDIRSAVDDLDEMSLTRNKLTVASTIKLDMSVAGQGVDNTPVVSEHRYPEWDYRLQGYRKDFCAVFSACASEQDDDDRDPWNPDDATKRRIRRIQRQFEALRPRRERVHRQQDGKELDIDAMVRSSCDLRATGAGSDQIYTDFRNQTRDLAAAILADVSLSTDSWLDGRRVLDVEKEALMTLALGLKASGDDNAIYSFSSRKRHNIRVDCLKEFDEEMSPKVQSRIAALKPGYYTRMGAAIRHVTVQLAERPNHHRLLLLISDGKPNDMDHYEGRYGIEDTRMAIREARSQGIAVFGVTVDEKARDYFPYLFGPGGGAIIPHIDNLPATLPAIFRNLLK